MRGARYLNRVLTQTGIALIGIFVRVLRTRICTICIVNLYCERVPFNNFNKYK